MTSGGGSDSGTTKRSGARALGLLAMPLNCLVLRALESGPKRQVELRRVVGSVAQSTLRSRLGVLERVGALVRRRRDAFPGTVEYEMARPGEELLFVLGQLERWLAAAPDGPVQVATPAAKAAIAALTEAWSTSMLRALAARPLSLTELDRIIAGLSYPSLERRLGALRFAGLIRAAPANGHRPYAVTPLLRLGIAPLTAAIRWERRHAPDDVVPLRPVDVEAAFLLATPLLRLPAGLSGTCRMAVDLSDAAGARRFSGAMVELDEGRVVACSSRLEGMADAWSSGPAGAWLDAVIAGESDGLEQGGDSGLARGVVDGLHRTLFRHEGSPQAS